jgi:NifU-like protein involved in Fe-S cluster formation
MAHLSVCRPAPYLPCHAPGGNADAPPETDLIELYSKRILALAAAMPRTGPLPAPDGTGKVRAPLCGSTVTVDLALDAGRVADYAQDVRACALGQAAASVVGDNIVGQDRATIQRARDELAAMLRDGPARRPRPRSTALPCWSPRATIATGMPRYCWR